MNDKISTLRRALAADYVIGLMPYHTRQRFEVLLKTDRALMKEVHAWQETLTLLTRDLTPVTPPESVWNGIQARLNMRNISFWSTTKSNLWKWFAGTAVVISLFTVIVFGLLQQDNFKSVYEAKLNDSSNVAVLQIASDGQVFKVEKLALQNPPTDKSLELWIVPRRGGKAISLGVIPLSGQTTIELTLDQQREIGKQTLLAITLEPLGGSPTGVATGPILYKGYLN